MAPPANTVGPGAAVSSPKQQKAELRARQILRFISASATEIPAAAVWRATIITNDDVQAARHLADIAPEQEQSLLYGDADAGEATEQRWPPNWETSRKSLVATLIHWRSLVAELEAAQQQGHGREDTTATATAGATADADAGARAGDSDGANASAPLLVAARNVEDDGSRRNLFDGDDITSNGEDEGKVEVDMELGPDRDIDENGDGDGDGDGGNVRDGDDKDEESIDKITPAVNTPKRITVVLTPWLLLCVALPTSLGLLAFAYVFYSVAMPRDP